MHASPWSTSLYPAGRRRRELRRAAAVVLAVNPTTKIIKAKATSKRGGADTIQCASNPLTRAPTTAHSTRTTITVLKIRAARTR